MSRLTSGHSIALLHNGADYFAALVRAIDDARHSVRLETYIFDFNEEHGLASVAVARALIRAAERGVACTVLVDGVGTGLLPIQWRQAFDLAGVAHRVFSPFGWKGYFQPKRWRRLHRKLCVVDGLRSPAVAFCGGINLLDDYFDPNHGVLSAPRFDFALRIEGPICADIESATTELWERLRGTRLVRRARLKQAILAWSAPAPPPVAAAGAHAPTNLVRSGTSAALLLRDNWRHRTRIEAAYRSAIGRAQHEVFIANAYFLPGLRLRNALVHAAQRGVKVTLLLQGRYEYFMQYHAARPLYYDLLAAGVEIHEYAASFLHAKVAVIDADTPHSWATVGSSNLDPFSLMLAREANVVVNDGAFAQELRGALHTAVAHHGQRVDPADFTNRSFIERALNWAAYAVMRGALWMIGKRY